MKAILWTAYGEPDVLQLEYVETPIPKDHEVLIKIQASTVTTGDCRMRACRVPKGFWLLSRLAFGLFKPRNNIIGMEFAGEIESVGKAVTQFKSGDRVCGTTGINLGANAEYIAINENKTLVKIPNNVSYHDAVSIIFGGLTAVHFLKNKAKIKNSQKVLINGASGVVGIASLQLASQYWTEITAVCSSSTIDLVKSLGALDVIDYNKESFLDNGETYDIILDTVGNLSYSLCEKSLKPEGKLVLINADLLTTLRSLFNKQLICGVAEESKESLNFLMEHLSNENFEAIIDSVYDLEDTVEAHKRVETGHKKGSVILNVGRKISEHTRNT